MSDLIRFGVCIDKQLLGKFDALTRKQHYATRSKALEDLIRQAIAEQELVGGDDAEVIGSIELVYDHHRRELLNRLTDIQHDFQSVILSTQHIHLDHHNCFEIIIVKGKKSQVEKLACLVKAAKGVTSASLRIVVSSSQERG